MKLTEKLAKGILLILSEARIREATRKTEVQTKLDEAKANVNAAWEALLNCEDHAKYDDLSRERDELEGVVQFYEGEYQYCVGREAELELLTTFIEAEIKALETVYNVDLAIEPDMWREKPKQTANLLADQEWSVAV